LVFWSRLKLPVVLSWNLAELFLLFKETQIWLLDWLMCSNIYMLSYSELSYLQLLENKIFPTIPVCHILPCLVLSWTHCSANANSLPVLAHNN
jgi:hypothetical protein